ncbi:MAG: class I SAM-dependent methyltransferase [Beijerinckiaceae bacterium]
MTRSDASLKFWNRHARRYAKAAIKDVAGYERTLARTRELIHGAAHVLEIGCGTGTTALRLAPDVTHMTATDISPDMIAIAREKAAAQNISNIRFEVAAAEHGAGADARCDAVLAFNALHLLDDAALVLKQIRQALKPGGLFISKTVLLTEMNILIRAAIPVMQWVRLAPPVIYFSDATLNAFIAEAGFEILESARHGTNAREPRLFVVARKPA